MSETLRAAESTDQPPPPGTPEQVLHPEDENASPPWGLTTKAIVASASIILIALIIWRFNFLLSPLVAAGVTAYLLHPIIRWLRSKVGISRTAAVLIVYFWLLLNVGVVGTWAARALADQTSQVWNNLPELLPNVVDQVRTRADELAGFTFALGPYQFGLGGVLEQIDWEAVGTQLRSSIQSWAGRSGFFVAGFIQRTVNTVTELFLVFIISIYIAIDAPRIGERIGEAAQQPGYRRDAERLVQNTLVIWDSYLRGQVILGLIIGALVWFTLSLLGVNNSLALGILSGLLEFLPIIGPVIGAGAAVIVALVQNTNPFGVSPWIFALIILGAMIVIQQLENSVLVPQIVGNSLNLHPIIVMVGVIMGSSLAGLLGAILAAPVLATLKLYGLYIWHKLLDIPPFMKMPIPEKPSVRNAEAILGVWSQLVSWIDNRRK